MRSVFRSVVPVLAGAAFSAAFLLYCGADPSASAAADAGSCECPEPPKAVVITAACDKVQTWTESSGQVTKIYFAEVPLPASIEPEDYARISAVLCGPQPSAVVVDCPATGGCDGYVGPVTDTCAIARPLLGEGKAVVECGRNEAHRTSATIRIAPD